MLNEEKILVLDKNNKDITSDVIDYTSSRIIVKFGDKIYSYRITNLKILSNPISIDNCIITTPNTTLSNVLKIIKFDNYIKVFFNNGKKKLYDESELIIKKDMLNNYGIFNVFSYFKEMASNLKISDVIPEVSKSKDDSAFLSKIYEKINFIDEDSIVNEYVNGLNSINTSFQSNNEIYPFSFNLSQQKALKNAFSNKISVIEGPPGTGKTQTILNIISNAIMNNKTVAILSNNNSATDNVYEKLEKQKLGSLCAKLGKRDNITNFLLEQKNIKKYPNAWKLNDNQVSEIMNSLLSMNNDIAIYLKEKNELALLKQELDELIVEEKYFKNKSNLFDLEIVSLPDFNSLKIHSYLMFLNKQKNKKEYFNKKVQFLSYIKFKFYNKEFYKNKIEIILDSLEMLYYRKRINELRIIIDEKESKFEDLQLEEMFKQYTDESMKILRNMVYKNYNNKRVYDRNTIKSTEELIKDYPIILSTTYSLLNSINHNFMFDYIIIDESSQADLISSFPALTKAKNLVIVGDSKQLPNIVDNNNQYDEIFKKYNIDERFNYTKNSLLDSIKKVDNILKPVILKEHYRCHPMIINFCNKKFYNNQLIILSEPSNSNPIKQYKCPKGNHARRNNKSWFNDRQARVIEDEVIPQEKIDIYNDSVGIITPYKEQKKYLKNIFKCDNLEIDTVHGFQGREKNTIIFSTVANEITKFLDNSNSINVAISRAIDKLYLVTPYEYKSKDNSNISNLISYINYNNFKIVQSKIVSIFDLLYKVNEKEKNNYLKTHTIFSRFDSETIMYNTIKEILEMDEYKTYDVKDMVYPLRKVVANRNLLTEEELIFIKHNSHIDFLIYNKFDKQPVLAIEVDGFYFHNRKKQIIRDRKKDSILKKCNIPVLRFKTNECKEIEKITTKLNEIISQKQS